MSGPPPARALIAPAPARPLAAPLVRRMAAFFYDGVLAFGLVFATGLVYGVATRQTNGLAHRSGLLATCFLVLGVYFVGLWSHGGQTLAMKTWHLRVVTAVDSQALTPGRALARYLAAWAWFLPPLAFAAAFVPPGLPAYLGLPAAWITVYALGALLHPRRQFWHDALCGTAVVDARPAAPLAP